MRLNLGSDMKSVKDVNISKRTKRAEFEAFDALPPELRQELNDAKIQIGAESVQRMLEKHGMTGAILSIRMTEERVLRPKTNGKD